MTTKKEELEFLIESWQKMEKRGCLSERGIEYLRGLERAYDILFPIEVVQERG